MAAENSAVRKDVVLKNGGDLLSPWQKVLVYQEEQRPCGEKPVSDVMKKTKGQSDLKRFLDPETAWEIDVCLIGLFWTREPSCSDPWL